MHLAGITVNARCMACNKVTAKPFDKGLFKTHIYIRAALERSTCTYDVAVRAGSRRIFRRAPLMKRHVCEEGEGVTLKITKIADLAAFSRPPRRQ